MVLGKMSSKFGGWVRGKFVSPAFFATRVVPSYISDDTLCTEFSAPVFLLNKHSLLSRNIRCTKIHTWAMNTGMEWEFISVEPVIVDSVLSSQSIA